MSNAVILLGRALLAALFVWAGFGKLMAAEARVANPASSASPIPSSMNTATA